MPSKDEGEERVEDEEASEVDDAYKSDGEDEEEEEATEVIETYDFDCGLQRKSQLRSRGQIHWKSICSKRNEIFDRMIEKKDEIINQLVEDAEVSKAKHQQQSAELLKTITAQRSELENLHHELVQSRKEAVEARSEYKVAKKEAETLKSMVRDMEMKNTGGRHGEHLQAKVQLLEIRLHRMEERLSTISHDHHLSLKKLALKAEELRIELRQAREATTASISSFMVWFRMTTQKVWEELQVAGASETYGDFNYIAGVAKRAVQPVVDSVNSLLFSFSQEQESAGKGLFEPLDVEGAMKRKRKREEAMEMAGQMGDFAMVVTDRNIKDKEGFRAFTDHFAVLSEASHRIRVLCTILGMKNSILASGTSCMELKERLHEGQQTYLSELGNLQSVLEDSNLRTLHKAFDKFLHFVLNAEPDQKRAVEIRESIGRARGVEQRCSHVLRKLLVARLRFHVARRKIMRRQADEQPRPTKGPERSYEEPEQIPSVDGDRGAGAPVDPHLPHLRSNLSIQTSKRGGTFREHPRSLAAMSKARKKKHQGVQTELRLDACNDCGMKLGCLECHQLERLEVTFPPALILHTKQQKGLFMEYLRIRVELYENRISTLRMMVSTIQQYKEDNNFRDRDSLADLMAGYNGGNVDNTVIGRMLADSVAQGAVPPHQRKMWQQFGPPQLPLALPKQGMGGWEVLLRQEREKERTRVAALSGEVKGTPFATYPGWDSFVPSPPANRELRAVPPPHPSPPTSLVATSPSKKPDTMPSLPAHRARAPRHDRPRTRPKGKTHGTARGAETPVVLPPVEDLPSPAVTEAHPDGAVVLWDGQGFDTSTSDRIKHKLTMATLRRQAPHPRYPGM